MQRHDVALQHGNICFSHQHVPLMGQLIPHVGFAALFTTQLLTSGLSLSVFSRDCYNVEKGSPVLLYTCLYQGPVIGSLSFVRVKWTCSHNNKHPEGHWARSPMSWTLLCSLLTLSPVIWNTQEIKEMSAGGSRWQKKQLERSLCLWAMLSSVNMKAFDRLVYE